MFVASGDIHLRDSKPKYRQDEFTLNQFIKFEQLLKYTEECTTSKTLLLTGDIFDSKGVNYATVVRALQYIKKYNINILLIPGQHDLRYHRQGLQGTPLGVLLQCDQVKLAIHDKVLRIISSPLVVGAGWNEEPTVKGTILITHRMVTKKGPLWPGHTDFISAVGLLKQYPSFKYILSGDNHKPHVITYKDRTNINVGSMMRTGKDQYKYRPAFWHVTEDDEIKKIPFIIESAKKVFNVIKITQDETFEKNKEKFHELTKQIKFNGKKPDFERILNTVIIDMKVSKAASKVIKIKMEDAQI